MIPAGSSPSAKVVVIATANKPQSVLPFCLLILTKQGKISGPYRLEITVFVSLSIVVKTESYTLTRPLLQNTIEVTIQWSSLSNILNKNTYGVKKTRPIRSGSYLTIYATKSFDIS